VSIFLNKILEVTCSLARLAFLQPIFQPKNGLNEILIKTS